jgi:hypothetical protein
MRRLPIVAAAAIGALCVCLIGTAAYAWPKGKGTPHPHQASGNIVLSATGATGSFTRLVTLAAVGPVGSSFTSGLTPVTITNDGDAPATLLSLGVSAQKTNRAFGNETWACVIVAGRELANQPLGVVEGYGQAHVPWVTIQPHSTSSYSVLFYAGPTEATGCGAPLAAFHAGHWGRGWPPGYDSGVAYPSGATNPAASSLTNAAQGGMLQLTVTTRYAVRHDHDHRCRRWQVAALPREEHDCP